MKENPVFVWIRMNVQQYIHGVRAKKKQTSNESLCILWYKSNTIIQQLILYWFDFTTVFSYFYKPTASDVVQNIYVDWFYWERDTMNQLDGLSETAELQAADTASL